MVEHTTDIDDAREHDRRDRGDHDELDDDGALLAEVVAHAMVAAWQQRLRPSEAGPLHRV